jgi:carbon monoxide dehydrogenase subunit G
LEKTFVIGSSPERIWELLLKAILRCMPLERMKPLSDNNVSALLRVKLGFISIPMGVNVETADVSPSESVVTIVKAKGLCGFVWLNQRFTFILKKVSEEETEITCKVVYEEMSPLLKVSWVLLSHFVEAMAKDTFNLLEERLKQWA